jgi:GH43 family beta-xylosidase
MQLRTRFSNVWPLAAAAFVVACSSGGSPIVVPPAACTFRNPIDVGADPWVIRRGPVYYMVESRDNSIIVYKSPSLTAPKQNAVTVWSAPASGWNETNVWAPELHFVDGLWYIYYAAGRRHPNGQDAPFTSQHAGVLQSVGTDPQGPFLDRGMLYTGNDVVADTGSVWSIDLTVGRIGGQLYAVWSGWAQNNTLTDRVQQNLYIARMSTPSTISSNRVLLSQPDASWERGTELALQEGPEFLTHVGQTFIVYSTNESWLPAYKLGQLRLTSSTADPMSPASFVKSGPVFVGTSEVYGVGHASYTTSPDSTEDWIVYHSKVDAAPGWNRVIRTQKYSWNADGSPNFGTPIPYAQSIPTPAGQCK